MIPCTQCLHKGGIGTFPTRWDGWNAWKCTWSSFGFVALDFLKIVLVFDCGCLESKVILFNSLDLKASGNWCMKFTKTLSNAKSWVNGGIHQLFDICGRGWGMRLVRVNVGVLMCWWGCIFAWFFLEWQGGRVILDGCLKWFPYITGLDLSNPKVYGKEHQCVLV